MAIELTMPKFGLTMHEGTVQRFFKAVGESVRAGQALYEVETEKILYEVEAPASGTLALTLCEDGETVECGRLVAVIAEPGEDLGASLARYRAAGSPAPGAAPPIRAAQPHRPTGRRGDCGGAERRPVSPVARKLAAELGVELDAVTGTGPGGRVTREDVERAAPRTAAATPAPASHGAALDAPQPRGAHPTTSRCAGCARRSPSGCIRASSTPPNSRSSSEADVSAAVEFRARHRHRVRFHLHRSDDSGCRARPYTASAGERAADRGRKSRLSEQINVGMAVALEEGLIVPVIRDADRKTCGQIAAETKALGEKARAGTAQARGRQRRHLHRDQSRAPAASTLSLRFSIRARPAFWALAESSRSRRSIAARSRAAR